MGWKKNLKKMLKDDKKAFSDFNNSNFDESSFIDWPMSSRNIDEWTKNNVLVEMNLYNQKLNDIQSVRSPKTHKPDSWIFKNLNVTEKFFFYPAVSQFKNIENYLEKQFNDFTKNVIMLSLIKFTAIISEKFWTNFNLVFAAHDPDEKILKRIFEVMQRTSVESMESIIDKVILLTNGKDLDAYKHHLTIEEIIDTGDNFTYHWSRMLDQVFDLCLDTLMFEQKYGKSSTESFTKSFFSYEEDTFEEFFEKTKTLAYQDEVNDALAYFGLSKMDKLDDFKKIYRTLAKKYHPDLNPDPQAHMEMKKINTFKSIIEDYYKKYNL